MTKKRRKPKPKPKPNTRSYRSKRKAWITHFEGELKSIMRQAAKAGAAEAIEHCANFWSVQDGYKRYIDHQIETQAEALIATVRNVVRTALQTELDLREARRNDRATRRKPKPKP